MDKYLLLFALTDQPELVSLLRLARSWEGVQVLFPANNAWSHFPHLSPLRFESFKAATITTHMLQSTDNSPRFNVCSPANINFLTLHPHSAFPSVHPLRPPEVEGLVRFGLVRSWEKDFRFLRRRRKFFESVTTSCGAEHSWNNLDTHTWEGSTSSTIVDQADATESSRKPKVTTNRSKLATHPTPAPSSHRQIPRGRISSLPHPANVTPLLFLGCWRYRIHSDALAYP